MSFLHRTGPEHGGKLHHESGTWGKPSVLYRLDVVCGSCGTGHLDMPVAPGKDAGKCRKCDAPLPALAFRRGDIMATAAAQARLRKQVQA